MAKLTAKARNRLPDSAFAGPGRSYPVEDKNHARAALSRVSEAVHKGRMSEAQAARIRARANRKLHGG